MHNKKMLLRCCVLSTLAVGLMITQDVIGTEPPWHWASDTVALAAVAFCWWGAFRPQTDLATAR